MFVCQNHFHQEETEAVFGCGSQIAGLPDYAKCLPEVVDRILGLSQKNNALFALRFFVPLRLPLQMRLSTAQPHAKPRRRK
jgi:hypothetical protein